MNEAFTLNNQIVQQLRSPQSREMNRHASLTPGDEIPAPQGSIYKFGRYVGINPQTGKPCVAWLKSRQKKTYSPEALARENNASQADLHFGDLVRIKRNTGESEDNWVLFGREGRGQLSVRKFDVDRMDYSPQDLQMLYPSDPATSLSQAQTTEDIKGMFMEMGGFYHGQTTYSGSHAIAMIEDYKAGYDDVLDLFPEEMAEKIRQIVKSELVNTDFTATIGLGYEPEGFLHRLSEARTKEEYETAIDKAGRFLYILDKRAQGIIVDSNGKITMLSKDVSLDPDLLMYEQAYSDLIGRYKIINDSAVEKIKRDFPGEVIDATVYMGAVIVTYDSSKKMPQGKLNPNYNFHDKDGALGSCKRFGDNTLGYIPVDINRDKNRHNQNPSATARHELNHHAWNVTNFILSRDSNPPIESAYWHTFPSKFAELGILVSSNKEYERFNHDALMYEYLSQGIYTRTLQDGLHGGQIFDIQQRLDYLNEAHSQMQDVNEFFFYRDYNSAAYSVSIPGGGTPLRVGVPRGENGDIRDIIAFQKVQTYVQIFLLARKMYDEYARNFLPYQQQSQLKKDFDDLFMRAAAYLGIAKTYQQAERLVGTQLKELIMKYTGLIPLIEEKKDNLIQIPHQGLNLNNVLKNPYHVANLNWLN